MLVLKKYTHVEKDNTLHNEISEIAIYQYNRHGETGSDAKH